jgi:hypothetical protein
MRRIASLLVAIAVIGVLLGLWRDWPVASGLLIACAFFGIAPAMLARNKLANLQSRREALSIEDRVALFLSLALFTVPIQLYVLLQFVTYRAGWEPGPLGRIIYRWWWTVSR